MPSLTPPQKLAEMHAAGVSLGLLLRLSLGDQMGFYFAAYFLSSAERPGGGSPKNSEVSDRGAIN